MSKNQKKVSENYDKFCDYIQNDFDTYKNSISKKDDLEKQKLTGIIINLCPSENGPDNSKRFLDFGLVKPQDYKRFKQELLKKIHFKENRFVVYKNAKELDNDVDYIISILAENFEPTIFFVDNSDSEIKSVFGYLRNAFAHGNYYKKDNFYIIFGKTVKCSVLQFFMIAKKTHITKIYDLLKKFKFEK